MHHDSPPRPQRSGFAQISVGVSKKITAIPVGILQRIFLKSNFSKAQGGYTITASFVRKETDDSRVGCVVY